MMPVAIIPLFYETEDRSLSAGIGRTEARKMILLTY